ncbi:glycosyltransferase family 39 protein [uncultured Draconibacterium sp.]|uniref:ArnT family glycosyltransferase n=1 Tax=uncultured Draconibacterium sp. TaxID=1573823 RepID=UPI0025D50BF5|nr:glycosyltransferase family 39 protein [uncultured Draconibacterium sp.]
MTTVVFWIKGSGRLKSCVSDMINNGKINWEKITSLVIGVFLMLTYILGLFVPVTSDAGKYAAISRIIYETGDWINLTIHFEPYLQKPPLLFWITAPFYFLFGPSEVAFKLPVLLYSVLAIYSTYRFARLFYSRQTARLAAIMLATSEFYFLFHNDIHTDVLLTANVIFAMWQLAAYFKQKRLINMLLAGLGIGLALISKGPIGVFVPVTAVFAHLIYTRRLKDVFNLKIVAGVLLCLLILALGLTGLYNQFGWEGLRFFFWENNAGRISGRIKGSSVDYFFYFHTALYIFLPWGILFFLSWFFEIKSLLKKKSIELYSLGAIVPYWIVISVAQAQSPHYFMVLSPFMAVLSAKWLVFFLQSERHRGMKKALSVIQYITIVFMWVLILGLCLYAFPSKSFLFWGGLIVLMVPMLLPLPQTQINRIMLRSVIAIVALSFSINAHLFPAVFKYQSVIPACNTFNNRAKEGEMLNSYLSQHRELFFYAKTPGYFLYDSADLKKCLTRQKSTWIYTNDEGLQQIAESGAGFELVESFKHRSLSGFTPGFINPATRHSRLKNMHLVHIFPAFN